MAKQHGCNFDDVNSLKTCFPHPSDSNQEIAVFPDPPHMLKLVRNTFGEKRYLFSSEIINWKYVEALHKLQESEGVHLGNKLRGEHIKFSKQKMKVKLAAQLFSSSVADAIDYCHNKLKLQDFIGSGATVEFLRLINTLFDVLNSRYIRQHGYKKAISKQNADLYLKFMHKAKAYRLSLKESRGGLPVLLNVLILSTSHCTRSVKTMLSCCFPLFGSKEEATIIPLHVSFVLLIGNCL
ncbi:DNA transposase THAP9 [Araneus ventricosus]|uniref:DNA transposase THAP9 n=1 Tax=Araneus ventricosus TaxID=182803 RepID=A0A4Y2A6C4_ARAVE|nr:DNA transposase THAP9 [Araneus ventricosus]